jgi:hypothetical protein
MLLFAKSCSNERLFIATATSCDRQIHAGLVSENLTRRKSNLRTVDVSQPAESNNKNYQNTPLKIEVAGICVRNLYSARGFPLIEPLRHLAARSLQNS